MLAAKRRKPQQPTGDLPCCAVHDSAIIIDKDELIAKAEIVPSCAPFVQDSAGILDKDELIAKVKEAAAAGPEGEAPAGYTFDAATGYWHSPGALA